MFRQSNENQFMISPVRNPSDIENSTHSDAKKSKNRHLVIINQLRRKEDAWDSRFHLQNIPEYRFGEDRHCETYKKMLIKKKSRKFVLKRESKGPIFAMGDMRRQMVEESTLEHNYKRPESHERPQVDLRLRGIHPNDMKSKDKVRAESLRKYTPLTETQLKEKKAQQEKLMATWDRLNIPMFHRETFLRCENIQNLKQTIEIIRVEIEELETNSSPIQLALRAVTARENCLKQLKTLTTKLESASREGEDVNEEELKQKASELLTHLRILSLNAVETILKWREYIQQTYYITRGVVKANQTIIIPFLYNDFNYLLKMKNDIRHFIDTPLANYFNFSAKSDPFLVYASKELENGENKIVLYISKNLINRIRASELVILEESVHEHINEKPNASASNSAIKSLESPSERSLHNEQQQPQQPQQKKTNNIKIRNTSVTTSAKGKRNTTAGYQPKPEVVVKHTNTSHPGSQKLPTEGDEVKKGNVSEFKPETTNQNTEIASKNVVTQETQVQAPKEKSPAKDQTPKKERETSVIEEASPEKKSTEAKTSTYIRAVDLYEDEVEVYVNKYLEGVDQSMKDSFVSDPKVLLERANLGQDPVWFELVDPENGGKRAGLAVAHIDNTNFTTRRMIILHFTTENRENYQDLLGKFVEYLWLNDECNEIKLSLYYLEDQNNNLGADKQLQDSVKKLGFRWKQLTNDKNTGKRYIDYSMKRPENVVSLVKKSSDEPIHVQSVVVLSDLKEETTANRNPKYIFDNRFAVLTAALKHCEQKLDKLNNVDTKRNKNYLQVISSLVKEDPAKIGDLTEKFQSLQEMETFVKSKFEENPEFHPKIDAKHSTNAFTTSLLNLIYRWKSFNVTHHKVEGQNRRYIKIHNNEDVVKFNSKYKNTSMYFIPTDDSEVNIFVIDNETIINDILSKEDIIEETISKLFSKLEKTPQQFEEDIWLPLFSLKEKNIDLEDAKSLLQGEYKLNYATSTCQIGLNGARVTGNLKVRPSNTCKVVEKPFLFGIVHEQVDFPLFATLVQPQDFLQFV